MVIKLPPNNIRHMKTVRMLKYSDMYSYIYIDAHTRVGQFQNRKINQVERVAKNNYPQNISLYNHAVFVNFC